MFVVCLHNVIQGEVDEFDRKCSRISGSEFERLLERIASRYRLTSFSQILRMLDEGRCEVGAAALSFDDGFMGVHRYAFPRLRATGIDAAIFVNPPLLDGNRETIFHFLQIELAFRHTERHFVQLSFMDRLLDLATPAQRIASMKQVKRRLKEMPEEDRERFHDQLLAALDVAPEHMQRWAQEDEKFRVMGKQEVLQLQAAGWTVGSHSLTHRSIGMLRPDDMMEEIAGSKSKLELILSNKVLTFAYPYGEPIHIGAAAAVCKKAGYRYAFTTVPGSIATGDDPFMIKRIDYKEFCRDYL